MTDGHDIRFTKATKWVDVRDFGAGEGEDDTDAIQAAIQAARKASDEEHRTLVTTRDLPYLAAIALILVLFAIATYALGVV